MKPNPTRPELNGVANALMILETRKSEADVDKAIKMLRKYAKFVQGYEEKPVFWHEFLKENGD